MSSASRQTLFLLATGLLCLASAEAETPKTVPLSVFAAQIGSAQQLAVSCAANASACDGGGLPDREQVEGSPAGNFRVTWQWLRDELSESKTASPAERTKKMKTAQAHLGELAAQAGADENLPAASFSGARRTANGVLARPEFRASVEGPTWTERQLARLQDWFLRLFTGMDRVGRRAPWLAPLIEWGCFAAAVAGLLFFVRQNLARQALRISLGEGLAAGQGERDSSDWARLAEERARARDWREAIHCLYWAAIALMESRRAWRPNVTRTPREYVRLLKPGSEAHRALRELTGSFERIWYGGADAGEPQYRTTLASFRALDAAKPERAGAADPVPGQPAAAMEGV